MPRRIAPHASRACESLLAEQTCRVGCTFSCFVRRRCGRLSGRRRCSSTVGGTPLVTSGPELVSENRSTPLVYVPTVSPTRASMAGAVLDSRNTIDADDSWSCWQDEARRAGGDSGYVWGEAVEKETVREGPVSAVSMDVCLGAARNNDFIGLVELSAAQREELGTLRTRQSGSEGEARRRAHQLLRDQTYWPHLVRDGLLTQAQLSRLRGAVAGPPELATLWELADLLEFKILKYRIYEASYTDREARQERQTAALLPPPAVRHLQSRALLGTGVVVAEKLRGRGALVIRALNNETALRELTWEMEALDKAGYLHGNDAQACNPGSSSNLLGVLEGVPSDPAPGSVLMRELLPPDFVRACPRITECMQLLQGLCFELQQLLPELGALTIPCQTLLTAYPPGAHYRRHLDSLGDEDNPRILSLVLYANASWQPEWGGELRWWPTDVGPMVPKSGVVEPVPGTPAERAFPSGGCLVIMWSRTVWHEILPVRGGVRRYALVQWLWKS